jgi:hypothetical protein
VRAIIVQATAMTFATTMVDRVRWRTVRLVGPLVRSWAFPRSVRFALRKLLGDQHLFDRYAGWIAGEVNRNDALALVQASRELSTFDASSWAGALGKPAGSLITTRDHLVPPRRQRALAATLGATVAEVPSDHLAALVDPEHYVPATLMLIDRVLAAR